MADIPNRTAPDNPLHEVKPKAGQHTPIDNQPDEPDAKTQHGGQSEARKGSQPGLTGHSDRSGRDANEGRPLKQQPGSEST